MTDPTLTALLAAAAGIAFIHTLLGPDHYVPFVAMAKIGRWSPTKTVGVTLACGLGHVASSIVLGGVGIALGIAGEKLSLWEDRRGAIAGWLLLGFGLAYMAWGLVRAHRGHTHSHLHAHANGTLHSHDHSHASDHVHVHAVEVADNDSANRGDAYRAAMTPWILFTIFVFGPCEPLIPLLMFPAASHHWSSVLLVTALFAVVTIATMLGVVLLMLRGLSFVSVPWLARYSHAAAGAALTACGLAIKFGL